jgi:alanine racemase
MHAPVHPSQSTRAEIDLRAFRSNLAAVRAAVRPGVKIMAVLKSNAYGHGVSRIAAECVRLGVDALAVARVGEGTELREQDVRVPILVCEVVDGPLAAKAVQDGLELTVTGVERARSIGGLAQREGITARVHVKVDTGMGRLGFAWQEAAAAVEQIARVPGLTLAGVFSHFATSEDSDSSFALEQLRRFRKVLDELRRRRVEVPLRHMANSGAVLALPASHLDMVRPGLMLYGYSPAERMQGSGGLTPVLSLRSRLSFLKQVSPGTSISYGRMHTTSRTTVIATVPIGYGDGYSRLLTGKAQVLLRGRRYPVVGAICMDHLMADLGPDTDAAVGDDVTLIGADGAERITCWDLARSMGTIPYEVTCLITPRVDRVFLA